MKFHLNCPARTNEKRHRRRKGFHLLRWFHLDWANRFRLTTRRAFPFSRGWSRFTYTDDLSSTFDINTDWVDSLCVPILVADIEKLSDNGSGNWKQNSLPGGARCLAYAGLGLRKSDTGELYRRQERGSRINEHGSDLAGHDYIFVFKLFYFGYVRILTKIRQGGKMLNFCDSNLKNENTMLSGVGPRGRRQTDKFISVISLL